MKINIKELRIGNYVLNENNQRVYIDIGRLNLIERNKIKYSPIYLTKENIEKYIDWSFEHGFNKSVKKDKHLTIYSFLMENIIEGSSDFEIRFIEDNTMIDNNFVEYLYDGMYLEFGLDNTLNNVQNLFFTSTGNELLIKIS
jgi:hypothetical protein